MTLNRKILRKVNSPSKSPKLANSTLRRRTLLKRLSSNGVQFGASTKANLKVVVRVRPENQREIDSNARSVVGIIDENMLVFDPKPEENDFFFQGSKQKFRDLSKKIHKDQKFIFERVFDPSSTNEEIFQTTTKDIIDTLLNGYNCSVFAYGATGSGKTYTMIGTEESPGITFMTVMELYEKISELENKSCEVGVSYLEVYNEMVRDLLLPGKPLSLHDTKQHVQVTGLSLHKPKDANELLKILAEGNKNRSQHPTDANSESSRSHAVFQVFVKQQNKHEGATTGVTISKLSMIDLAGSERGSATGFKGVRFREGANINKSLLALGNCINALADGKGHVNYRDSKLTRLLKDSLGGNCRSVMIATVTKSALSFEDTYNTLRYANRAKTIKTTLKKNFMNVDQHVAQYLKIMNDLRVEVTELKQKIRMYEEEEVTKATVYERSSPLPFSDDERKIYEETIQDLQQKLEIKERKDSQVVEWEKEFLSTLSSLNGEVKSIQREILQLETAERELEYKIYSQKSHVVKMGVFVFASTKLEKGISKSERAIQTFQKNIKHIIKQKSVLTEKCAQVREKIVNLCQNFKEKCPLVESEENMPEPLYSRLRDMEMEQNTRNLMQIQEYFCNLVQGLLQNEASSEKLILLLLATVKDQYLKLKMHNVCDDKVDQLLENIYGMLDSSRIEWADLKNTRDSFGEQILADHVTLVPLIDEKKLTEFKLPLTVRISPTTCDVSRIYKSNIIKPIHNPETSEKFLPTLETKTYNLNTPVSSKKFQSLIVTPTSAIGENSNNEFVSDDIILKDIPETYDATFLSNNEVSLHIKESTIAKEKPLQVESHSGDSTPIRCTFTTPSPVLNIATAPLPVLNIASTPSPVLNSANTKSILSRESPTTKNEHILGKKEKDSDVTFCVDKPIEFTYTPPSPILNVVNTTISPSGDNPKPDDDKPADNILPSPTSSPVLSNTTNISPRESPTAENEHFKRHEKDTNVTFYIDSPISNTTVSLSRDDSSTGNKYAFKEEVADSTFCLDVNPSPAILDSFCDPDSEKNTTITVSPRVKTNALQPLHNSTFKRPLGMTPSKFSVSKLTNFSSIKSSVGKSIKRSSSALVLQNDNTGNVIKPSTHGVFASGKENSLKRSTSFLHKNVSGSSTKSKEITSVKSVAFGSTYSNTPKLGSKRSLTYSQLPSVTSSATKK